MARQVHGFAQYCLFLFHRHPARDQNGCAIYAGMGWMRGLWRTWVPDPVFVRRRVETKKRGAWLKGMGKRR